MKLWLKQTLICLLVIMLAFCACLYFFVIQQTQQMLDDAQNSALQNTNVFCEHLATLDRTSNTGFGTDETTLRALIQYTFSSYAHLLQSKNSSYSLVMDGAYLYNISAYQPMQLLPVNEQAITAQRLVEMNGVPLLVTARNTIVLNLPITVYTVQDASDTFARIDNLTRNAQLALLTCLLLSGILLPLTLRRTLRPLRKLTQVSEEISGGEYSLRSRIESKDEVGELSASFDHMAETVEQKILDLEEQARRRELLLGALTHEMKTPMTAIIGFSDKLTTPYGCAVQIFLLLFQYVLLMSTIQLTFTVLKSRKAGIIAALIINFAGYVLTPDRFMTWLHLPMEMQYYANLLSAWLSPLQHATYTMHNFGYDLLPRVHTSYLILGGTSVALMIVSAIAMRRFSFNFTGGYSDE